MLKKMLPLKMLEHYDVISDIVEKSNLESNKNMDGSELLTLEDNVL